MSDKKAKLHRREFLVASGRVAAACALGGIAARVLMKGGDDADFDKPGTRYAWRINPDNCVLCGQCATACVRRPSAVKCVNDQKKCSLCVVCYGHVKDQHVDSKKINTAPKVCPNNAVIRKDLTGGIDGPHTYTIDQSRCVGCAECASRCSEHGTQSMFLIIRPDLCLNCNECEIAKTCPAEAVERVPIAPEDDFRGEYGVDWGASPNGI